MSSFINAHLTGASAVFPNATESDPVTRDIYRQNLTAAGYFLQGELQRATPFGVAGKLQKAWAVEYDEDKNQVHVVNPTEYALAVDQGRDAGKGVPIKPLQLWVKRKLQVTTDKEAKAIALAISRKKKYNRTPGQGFVARTFDASVETINAQFLEPIGAEIIKRQPGGNR